MKKTAKTDVEKKFTLDQAVEELKAKETAIIEDRKARLTEFVKLMNEAMQKTNCTLQIDPNSPLNNLKIMPLSNV